MTDSDMMDLDMTDLDMTYRKRQVDSNSRYLQTLHADIDGI